MMARSTLFALGLAVSGCTLGSVGDDGLGWEDDEPRPAEALCESVLRLSGTVAPPGGTPSPAELGCVPEGTWTVRVAVEDVGDCAAAMVGSTYTYTVVGEGRDRTISYGGPEDSELGIHAGGNGQCEATFEHIWAAGEGRYHVLLLKPYFQPGTTTILGEGTYQLWSKRP